MTVRTDLVCTKCGNVTTIQRRRGKKTGHIKDLWCYSCQEITKHYEVNDISIFMYDENPLNEEKEQIKKLILKRRNNGGSK